MSQSGAGLAEFANYFSGIEDPRINRRKKHSLMNVVVIALCAVITGSRGWQGIAEFGEAYFDWLKTFLDLQNGTPSKDTFRRVFSVLDPKAFYDCFLKWQRALAEVAEKSLIVMDGKTLRHSFDTASQQSPLHLMTAWAVENQVVLAQMKVEDKTNEITAIRKLLDFVNVKGAIVTVDAMHCHAETAEKIALKQSDYVFALKGNQSELNQHVRNLFKRYEAVKFEEVEFQFDEVVEKDHGRIETRKYWQIHVPSSWKTIRRDWKNLKTLAMVEAHREIHGEIAMERRYYISSLELDVKQIARAIRGHWSIENQLHYSLDVTFNEDECRIRQRTAAENFSSLRKMALSLLKKAPGFRERKRPYSMKMKGVIAGWKPVEYLSRILVTKI